MDLIERLAEKPNREVAEQCCSWVQKRQNIDLATLDALLNAAVDRFSCGDQACRAALQRLVMHGVRARKELFPTASIKNVVDHACLYQKEDPRVCFGSLDAMARSGGDAAKLVTEALPSQFLESSFALLAADGEGEAANSHLIGHCLVALLGSAPVTNWFEYLRPFLSNPLKFRPLVVHFFEPALRQRRDAKAAFDEFFKLVVNSKDEAGLKNAAEIAVLRAAQSARLDVGDAVQQSEGVRTAMRSANKQLRADALALMCSSSRKLTAPISNTLISELVEALPTLLGEGDPKSRSDALAALRQLRIRLLTQLRTSMTAIAQLDCLCQFVAGWCALSLKPTSPYRCLIMAARLLTLFDIPLRDFGLEETLAGALLSDYADVRSFCCDLLVAQKVKPPTEAERIGLRLVGSSRGGDAGARVLQWVAKTNNSSDKIIDEVMQRASAALETESNPLHGFLGALRVLQLNEEQQLKAIELVKKTWEVCVPPLKQQTPEGMDDAVVGRCWKACKEAALLVEQLGKTASPLLPTMAEMLSEMTHWGAFASLPAAFTSAAKGDLVLAHKLVWEQIQPLANRAKKRTVTRRSAGLPMLVCAALEAQFDASIVEALFELAENPLQEGEADELELPQVHGMNCLRAVLVDAKLTKDTAKFVERGVKSALNQFCSPVWSLRNCASLLFTALFKRLFGVRGVPMAASVFFHRYGLKQLLLSLLTGPPGAVFPVLSVLAKLLPLSASDDSLTEFWEPVISLLGSESWKIREMAARCVGTMTPLELKLDCAAQFVGAMQSANSNTLHGYALAVCELAETNTAGNTVSAEVLEKLREATIRTRSMEIRTSLFKAYRLLGGTQRLIKFEDLPHPKQLNPSIATFEAEQVIADPPTSKDTLRYAYGWAPVLRALPASAWSLDLVKTVALDGTQLPDLRALALRVCAQQQISLEEQVLSKLLSNTQPPECRQEALVLLASKPNVEYGESVLAFAADDEPVEFRRSAARSLQFAVPQLQNCSARIRDNVYLAQYVLLSDEEEDIRLLAAKAHCSNGSLLAPSVCEQEVLVKISPLALTRKLARNIAEDAEKAVAEAPSIDALFVVEEESLFRDEPRQVLAEGKLCGPPTPEELKAAQHAMSLCNSSMERTGFPDVRKEACRVRERARALFGASARAPRP